MKLVRNSQKAQIYSQDGNPKTGIPTSRRSSLHNTIIAVCSIGLGIAFLLSATFSFTQDQNQQNNPRRDRRMFRSPEQRVEQLKEQLNLSEEQQKNIQAIYEKQQEKMQKLREGSQNNTESQPINWREEFTKNREETEALIAKELTEEQLKTYQKNQEEMRKQREEGRRRFQQGPPPDGPQGPPPPAPEKVEPTPVPEKKSK